MTEGVLLSKGRTAGARRDPSVYRRRVEIARQRLLGTMQGL